MSAAQIQPCESSNDNVQTLRQAAKLQTATRRAIDRIKSQVSDTTLIGCTTLAELQEQREHLDKIMVEGDRLEVSVNTTEKLLNRYSFNSLRFTNARAACKLVKKEEQFRANMASKAKERAAEIDSQIEAENEIASSHVSTVTKHSERRSMYNSRGSNSSSSSKSRKKNSSTTCSNSDRKGLLFGIVADETRNDEWNQLEQADADIEVQLEGLGSQIEQLVRMSDAMASTVQTHDKALVHVTKQLDKANTKQQVSNHRSRWFLSGKKRESYERSDFFSRHSIARKVVIG
ncbi:hypothetical protein MPSEU_000880100 [Mayamaea pseudoterrestris]|nr:hypothetical protein MPSEU_000880100 [Mayamaea pseudoterrestris]